MLNLRAVDLNLLVALDALLEEGHVSRAAARIGLSQPAMSNALERCRHVFKDTLLERAPGGMRLTAKAQALRQPLKTVLADVAALLQPPAPTLAELRQTIRLLLPDVPGTLILQPLLADLVQSAPHLQLVICPWRGAEAALADLRKGELDLAVSVFPQPGEGIHLRELRQEHYVVAMRRHHPAISRFSLDSWLAYPHVRVSGHGATYGPLDVQLGQLGRQRTVGLVVPSFTQAAAILYDSDYMALLPSSCLPDDWPTKLAVLTPPIPVAGFPLHLAWHVRRAQDVAVQHVLRGIAEAIQRQDAVGT